MSMLHAENGGVGIRAKRRIGATIIHCGVFNGEQMNRIKETPRCDRPREKLFRKGPDSLTNEELVAILIGSGTRGMDVRALAKRACLSIEENFLELQNAPAAFMERLRAIKGLGPAKCALFAASCELFSRLSAKKATVIKNARDVLPFLEYLAAKRREHFVCVHLNGANRVVSSTLVSIGLIDQTLVHPREVFSEAVRIKAAKVIVAHNHPAGVLYPSDEDVEITKKLCMASTILGIALIDHIIITDGGYFSFKEEGLL
jgi:DNA repair protein RadC